MNGINVGWPLAFLSILRTLDIDAIVSKIRMKHESLGISSWSDLAEEEHADLVESVRAILGDPLKVDQNNYHQLYPHASPCDCANLAANCVAVENMLFIPIPVAEKDLREKGLLQAVMLGVRRHDNTVDDAQLQKDLEHRLATTEDLFLIVYTESGSETTEGCANNYNSRQIEELAAALGPFASRHLLLLAPDMAYVRLLQLHWSTISQK